MSAEISLGTLVVSAAAFANPPPAKVDLQRLLADGALIQGNRGAGKSWLLRRLLESAYGIVQQVVIDPEGEFVTLADAFDYLVLPRAEVDRIGAGAVALHIRQHGYSAILDLSDYGDEDRLRVAGEFAAGLVEVPRELWRPLVVAVDEIQVLAPRYDPGGIDKEIRFAAIDALADVMGRGRKRGLAGIFATQRLAETATRVHAKAGTTIIGRTIFDRDLARAAELLGLTVGKARGIRKLADGEFTAVGPAFGPARVRFKVGATRTQHVGKTPEIGAATAIDGRAARALLSGLPDGVPVDTPSPRAAGSLDRAPRIDGWTEAEDQILIDGYAARKSAVQIVHDLNDAGFCRPQGGITMRAAKLGLTATMVPRWTEAEKSIVRAGYAAKKGRPEILSELHAAGFTYRTSSSLGWIAGQIGLNQAPKPWTEAELATLRARYAEGVMPRFIAKELMRPYGGIVTKANSLGLRLHREWTNDERRRLASASENGERLVDLAKELDRPYANVAKIAEKMGLKFQRPAGEHYHSGVPQRANGHAAP